MKRFSHYVRPNENSETIQRCIFVDTETDEVAVDEKHTGHRLRFGWAAETRRNVKGNWTKPTWSRFTDVGEFWLWAMCHTRPKTRTWMWCHNASFDYPVLDAFSHLPAIGWKLVSLIMEAPPFVARYRSGLKTLVLADTLNIWRMSLKEMGKRIGLPKLEYNGGELSPGEFDRYCKRDVEIILRSVCDWADFLRDKDMGGFCPTIAGQAMRSFRHKWLDTRILIETDPISLPLARNCYHGGRCEAHYIGEMEGPIYSLDVNSMYPHVMATCEMPVRLRGISKYVQPHHMQRLLQEYCVCAHVRIKTDEPAFAVVHDGKLCFPIGEFEAFLTTPELQYALDHCALLEIYMCCSYDKERPFERFALDIYQNKESASRAGRDIEARHWKLVLNSFYGKWGQSGRHWVKSGTCDAKLFDVTPDINAQTLKKTAVRHFGGIAFKRADEAEGLESHPAIAAHITAHARMILWTLIRQLAPEDYLYCDTDGLLVTQRGRDSLSKRIDNFTLGGLKEVAEYEKVRIYGCKDLVLDNKATLKGIRSEAERIDEKTYRQVKWTGLRGLLRARSLKMPLTSLVDKTLRRVYTKGIVGPDGFVTPLHLTGPITGGKA